MPSPLRGCHNEVDHASVTCLAPIVIVPSLRELKMVQKAVDAPVDDEFEFHERALEGGLLDTSISFAFWLTLTLGCGCLL